MNRIKALVVALAIIITTSVFGQVLPSRYHRYQQVLDTLAVLRDAYPQILKLDTMGYSTRDSIPMLRMKISNNPNIDEDQPAIFVFGGVHADEVLGPEIVLGFIKDIVHKYSIGDPATLRYIDSLEIFAIPFINPEGHIVVENGDTDWRKNKCDNDSNGIFNYHDGVDNNRNYDFGWSIDAGDSITVPESLMYKGTAPFTQSENRAIRDFGWTYRPMVALDFHSPTYGRSEKAYYPWYWYSNQGGHGFGPDEALMLDICTNYCSRIVGDSGGTYEARRALVNKGDLKTYFYGNFGTAAFSVEVSDTTIQNPNRVDGIVARNLPGIYYLLGRTLGSGITGVIRDSVTLEPIEAEVQVVERINADINPRLSRPDFGRYRRLLASGSYTLKFIKTGYRMKQVNSVSVGSSGPTTVNVMLAPLHPRPPAPQLMLPTQNDSLRANMLNFDWSDQSLATKYLIEVAQDSLFTNLNLSDSNVAVSNYTPDSQLTTGSYFWRVKGGNSNGWGPYSSRFGFFIHPGTSISDNSIKPTSFRLYQNFPNPFNSSTKISFDLAKDSRAVVEIFDITGAEIAKPLDEFFPAGYHSFIWSGKSSDGQTLATGIYFCRLRAEGNNSIKRLVLLK